jgi:sugar lactone lactonase YvrE
LLAGSVGGFGHVDGPSDTNRLNQPGAAVVDAQGTTFIADTANHAIRRLDAAGVLTTLAGLPGVSGSQDGSGNEARFNAPAGIALDGQGGLFVADSANHTLRRVSADGVVTTVAGKAGDPGLPAPFGTAVPGSVARFNSPVGLVFDGEFVYVADRDNHAIRRFGPVGGRVDLFAGPADGQPGDAQLQTTRAAARFREPVALAFDVPAGVSGTLWIADSRNDVIRKVLPAGNAVFAATALPGTSGGAVIQPLAIAVDQRDGRGIVFCQDGLINRVGVGLQLASVEPLNAPVIGFKDGALSAAQFDVHNTTQDSSGLGGQAFFDAPRAQLVVADAGNHVLRVIDVTALQVRTVAGQAPAQSGFTSGQAGNAARFSLPVSLAASTSGAVIVGELFPQGASLRLLQSDGFVVDIPGTASGLAASFVAEAPNRDRFASSGNKMVIARTGAAPLVVAPVQLAGPPLDGPPGTGRFGSVRGMAVDSLGRLVFADLAAHAVRRMTPDGVLSRLAGRYDVAGFQVGDALDEALFDKPVDVAVTADDIIFVLDAGNRAVLRIAADSTGRQQVSVAAANFEDPRALAIDGAGRLYVAEGTAQTIVRVESNGDRTVVVGSPSRRGFVPGDLPGGLALPPRTPAAGNELAAVGMRIVGDRLLLTQEQAVVQVSPLPE